MTTLATALPADYIPRYPTIEDLAKILGVEERWIYERKKEGVIEPRLTRGALQFDRGAIVRLATFQVLQENLGAKSALPGEIVRAIAQDLDQCAAGPWLSPASAQIAIQRGFARVVEAVRTGLHKKLTEIVA